MNTWIKDPGGKLHNVQQLHRLEVNGSGTQWYVTGYIGTSPYNLTSYYATQAEAEDAMSRIAAGRQPEPPAGS